jgi:hypothetical protein
MKLLWITALTILCLTYGFCLHFMLNLEPARVMTEAQKAEYFELLQKRGFYVGKDGKRVLLVTRITKGKEEHFFNNQWVKI